MRVVPNVITRTSDKQDQAYDLAQPLTPKSERSRASYGALGISLANLSPDNRCVEGKCFYAAGHAGPHAGMRNP